MVSRDRLFAAAAHEFAARGFDGAKVDRIAARARVNKAMLYYHFKSKAALYRADPRDMFSARRGLVAAARATRRHTRTSNFAGSSPPSRPGAVARPHFPPIWLRESPRAAATWTPPSSCSCEA